MICNNYYDVNRGLVNRGQRFQVQVTIENRGRTGIDSVVVRLISDGNSIVENPVQTIDFIDFEHLFKAAKLLHLFITELGNEEHSPDTNKMNVNTSDKT